LAANPDTAVAAIFGDPVAHSKSPAMHNAAYAALGMNRTYTAFRVTAANLAASLRAIHPLGIIGVNLTVPHKEAALQSSQPDDRARAVGAANTLWLDGAGLRSTNTDVEGFLNNLDACAPGWDRGPAKAVVLGAGGAARAVIYALHERGVAHIIVVNRTYERAEALRERFGARVHPARWDERNAALDDAALLVNTTTLGMYGQPQLALDVGRLPSHAIVAELVYVPLVTPLVQAARARGHRTADGLGMLMHQAVGGFARWFGKKPEVTAQLRALLEADLGAPPTKPQE